MDSGFIFRWIFVFYYLSLSLLLFSRYRRYSDRHEFQDELFSHKDDVEDMDISPFDECIF
jgi:hypothetical protein